MTMTPEGGRKSAIDPARTVLAFVVIFVGGALGAVLREVATPLLATPWPWLATALINIAACFLIGILYARRDRLHHVLLQFGAIGFCGGLSTFSHFAFDIDMAWQSGGPLAALAPVAVTVVFGLGAALAGEALARR